MAALKKADLDKLNDDTVYRVQLARNIKLGEFEHTKIHPLHLMGSVVKTLAVADVASVSEDDDLHPDTIMAAPDSTQEDFTDARQDRDMAKSRVIPPRDLAQAAPPPEVVVNPEPNAPEIVHDDPGRVADLKGPTSGTDPSEPTRPRVRTRAARYPAAAST